MSHHDGLLWIMGIVAAVVNVNVDTGDMDTVDVDTDDTVDVVLLSQVISVDISHLSV